MNKKTICLKVNIPSDYLTTGTLFHEFVTVNAVVHTDNDTWYVSIKNMTFRGCMAFAIKSESIAKFMDMVEDLLIQDAKRFEECYAEDELLYHEIAEHGI